MNESGTRNVFPTLRSILDSEALAEAVRAAYALDVSSCVLLKPQLSDLYRLDTAQGPRIMRVYPHGLNLGKWIEAELRILQTLDERGVPVSLPIPRSDGSLLLPLEASEGERNAVLFQYAHGRSLKRSKNLEDFSAFGEIAARMHLEAGDLPEHVARVPLDTYSLLARPMDLLGAAYPEKTDEMEELREAVESVTQGLEPLRRQPETWGFCHGNLNFSNVHLTAQGAFCLFDFEYCGPGWPAYDIATVLNFESREPAKAFLEGYEGVRPLLEAERAALPWLQVANKLWMLGTAASLTCVFGSQIITGDYFDHVMEFVRERMDGVGR